MKRIFTLSSIILLGFVTATMGQLPGPYYRQFFFNPYLFNPAYVAINNELEANLAYRQQWTNFKDAPVTAGVSVQFPASDRVALGFSILSDKQVLLRNTNFMATFGYIVPLAAKQSLRFGLSAGVGVNKLDLTAAEWSTNDPSILNASVNNFFVDGNFGVVYNNAGLRVGFALTDIFKSNAFTTEKFNEFKLSNLKNRLYSVSYRFDVGIMGNVSLEPYFLYRQTADGLQNGWEAASLVYFQDKLWTGVSYNQNNGLALFLGMNLKEKFRFSYSYEFPPFNSGFTSNSSHELHLGIKLGKKNSKAVAKKATPAPILANAKTEEFTNHPSKLLGGNRNPVRIVEGHEPQPKDMETPITIEEEKLTKENVKTSGKAEGVKKAPIKTPASRPSEAFTMTRGHHYVVVGVFKILGHSMKFTKELKSKGYTLSVVLNPKNNFYYVYIQSALEIEEAKRIRNDYRRKNLFKEAWIYTME